jgi:methionyl-tRNA formyltransferase
VILRNSFYLYPGGNEYGEQCRTLAVQLGLMQVELPDAADVAIAPLLTRRLTPEEWEAPYYGTLIFHPSALPYRRGPDAIRQTVAAGERVSAATWFWCDSGLDTGDICEQELVILAPGESPGRAYHTRFIPAGLVALRRALIGILGNLPRRLRQDETLATYDGYLTEAHP